MIDFVYDIGVKMFIRLQRLSPYVFCIKNSFDTQKLLLIDKVVSLKVCLYYMYNINNI